MTQTRINDIHVEPAAAAVQRYNNGFRLSTSSAIEEATTAMTLYHKVQHLSHTVIGNEALALWEERVHEMSGESSCIRVYVVL
jgi:hypothetical protein